MKFDVESLETGSAEINFEKIHDDLFVDLDEQLKPQPVAISIGKHPYKSDYYPTPFGSYGDFSCVVGASKSKKTFFKSLLTGAYIGGKSNHYAGDIQGHNTEGKFVIEFDTEQSKFHAQRVFRRVIELVGYRHDNYKCFYLREKSPEERMAFIDWVFTKSKYKDRLGLVVIDGVADLVNNTNDLEQANDLVTKLLKWSGETHSHIITVLHRNFGTAKPVGHVGSAVLKKAETVAFVEVDNDLVLVKPEYTRNIPFDEFRFGVNQDWLPYVENNNYQDNIFK